MVGKATGHNYNFVHEKVSEWGAVICRSGDVIPKIIDVVKTAAVRPFGSPCRGTPCFQTRRHRSGKTTSLLSHFSRHQERRSSSVYEALRKRYSLSQRYRLSHRNVLQLFVVPKQEPMYHTISVRPSTGSHVEAIVLPVLSGRESNASYMQSMIRILDDPWNLST
jgi:hypothetical protein